MPGLGQPTQDLGRYILGGTDLDSYGLFIVIGIFALITYMVFYNIVICLAMKYLSCNFFPPNDALARSVRTAVMLSCSCP